MDNKRHRKKFFSSQKDSKRGGGLTWPVWLVINGSTIDTTKVGGSLHNPCVLFRWKTYTGDNLDELLPALTKHYNMSMLLDKQFWADAASYPARVNARYMPNGKQFQAPS